MLKSHAAQVASSTIADGWKRETPFCIQFSVSFCNLLVILLWERYLKAVGEDDIGVHGPDVQMVNEGALDPVWNLLQGHQFVLDLITDLMKQGCIKLIKLSVRSHRT